MHPVTVGEGGKITIADEPDRKEFSMEGPKLDYAWERAIRYFELLEERVRKLESAISDTSDLYKASREVYEVSAGLLERAMELAKKARNA